MPQIWLTDKEIGVLFDIPAGVARLQAIEADWPRRHSSDGQTRFKLSDSASHLFMIGYAKRFYEGEAGLRSKDAGDDEERFEDEVDGDFEDEAETVGEDEPDEVPDRWQEDSEAPPDPQPQLSAGAQDAKSVTSAVEDPPTPIEEPRATGSPVTEPRSAPEEAAVLDEAEAKRADAQYWAGVFQRAFEDAKTRL